MKLINIEGQKFNKLLAIKKLNINKKEVYWLCKCECGNEKKVLSSHLRHGKIKSCGCLKKEKPNHQTHGMSYTSTYKTWSEMKYRCNNSLSPVYNRYGGRGISHCNRWENFLNFLEDMGIKPQGTSLDRINNNGNYESSNCRWATNIQQANNKRNNRLITFKNKTMTLAEWSRMTGIKVTTILMRLDKYSWSIEKALTKGGNFVY